MGEQRDYGDETDAKDPRTKPSVPYRLTADDKRLLRALRITAE